MRKAVLYSSLAGCFGLAVLLEALVTEPPDEVPEHRLVLELGGDAPRTIPEEPPAEVHALTRDDLLPPGPGPDPQPPGPEPQPEPTPQPREYTVQAGDSFWTIARDQLGAGHRYPEICRLNGLSEDHVLAEGAVLKIPVAGAGRAPPLVLDDPGRKHTVVEGETLSEIAARYLGSAERYREIQELNGIEDPSQVRAGTVLRIPDA